MRRFVSVLAILALCLLPARAQVPMTGAGLGAPASSVGSSVIKMIQAGTVTVASGATSGTYTISPAITTLGNAMLVWNGETNNDTGGLDGRQSVILTLTNTTTVTATRVSNGAFTVTIAFTIVEFASGVNSIQAGTISVAATNPSNTATISLVGANAFVLYQGYNTSGNSSAVWPQAAVTLTNTTTVTAFVQTSATLTQSVRYMVVDLDSTVVTSAQHIANADISASATTVDTISSVTVANSSLMWGGSVLLNGVFSAGAYNTFLTNGTTVTKTRISTVSTGSRTVYYAVVNWAASALNGSVQRTSSALAISASTSAVWTLGSSVSAAKSFVNYNGFLATSTTSAATVMPSVALTGSGTTVTASLNTSGTSTPTAEVVQFK